MFSRTPHRAIGAAIATMLAASAPARAGDSFQLSTGTDYSSGKFGGSSRTELLVVPLAARLRWQDWTLRATVPYVTIRGPADVTVLVDDSGGSNSGSGSSGSNSSGSSGGSGSNSGGSGDGSGERGSNDSFASSRSVSGIGDATLSLTRSFDQLFGTPFYLDVTGRVKLATGKSGNGLGTGTTDYAAGGEFGWTGTWGGLFAGGQRRFLGNHGTLRQRDGWQAGAGTWVELGPRIEAGAQYLWRSATVPGGIDSRSVEGNFSVGVGRSWLVGFYASAGLSDAAPDYGVGANLAWKLPI